MRDARDLARRGLVAEAVTTCGPAGSNAACPR